MVYYTGDAVWTILLTRQQLEEGVGVVQMSFHKPSKEARVLYAPRRLTVGVVGVQRLVMGVCTHAHKPLYLSS